MNCNGDDCDVAETIQREKMLQGLPGPARAKLMGWLGWEPIDYDAPGSTVREQGV